MHACWIGFPEDVLKSVRRLCLCLGPRAFYYDSYGIPGINWAIFRCRMSKVCAIGIDLGTTYSCVGVFQHGKVEIIANDVGNRTTPSFVAFTEEERLIGDSAATQAALNPANTVFDAKRLIGRNFNDASVQSDMKHFPFEVINADGKPKIQVSYLGEKRQFFPEEISAMVLTKMKETAEGSITQSQGMMTPLPDSPSPHLQANFHL